MKNQEKTVDYIARFIEIFCVSIAAIALSLVLLSEYLNSDKNIKNAINNSAIIEANFLNVCEYELSELLALKYNFDGYKKLKNVSCKNIKYKYFTDNYHNDIKLFNSNLDDFVLNELEVRIIMNLEKFNDYVVIRKI